MRAESGSLDNSTNLADLAKICHFHAHIAVEPLQKHLIAFKRFFTANCAIKRFLQVI